MANISPEDDRKDFELRQKNGGIRPHGRVFPRTTREEELADAQRRADNTLAALRAFNQDPRNFKKGKR